MLLSIHTHFPLGITFRIRDLEVFYGMGSQLFCELVPPASRCLWFQINGVACLGGVPPAKGAGRGTFRSSEWLRSTSQHDSAPFTLNGVTHGNQACSHYTKRRADNTSFHCVGEIFVVPTGSEKQEI